MCVRFPPSFAFRKRFLKALLDVIQEQDEVSLFLFLCFLLHLFIFLLFNYLFNYYLSNYYLFICVCIQEVFEPLLESYMELLQAREERFDLASQPHSCRCVV